MERSQAEMQTHTIEVTGIPDSILELLDARAREKGSDRNTYLRDLIERDVKNTTTLRDLFAPVREDIRASGMSEEEVDRLFEEARQEAYRERQAKRHE